MALGSFLLLHLLALLVVVCAAAGAGTLILGARFPLALRCAMGLAAWAHALFVLALAGWLHDAAIVALLLLAIAGGLARARPWPALRPMSIGALVFAPLFLLALFPPLAFDETLYHLPFVRVLAESGALRFQPSIRFPAFPVFQELLCVPVLRAFGDTATHLVSLVELAIAAALVAGWRRGGRLAAALVLGSPIALQLATIGYVDSALMLFVTAGFFCLDRSELEDRTWLALAGAFFGSACGVKYLGGYFAVGAVLLAAILGRTRLRAACTVALTVLATALPATLWITATTGNPVFPFFGSSAWGMPLPDATFAERATHTRAARSSAISRGRIPTSACSTTRPRRRRSARDCERSVRDIISSRNAFAHRRASTAA